MLSIDIDELVNFVACSYRYSFSKTDAKLNSFALIKSNIYSKLLDYATFTLISGANVSLHKLNAKLNLIWSEIKPSITIPINLAFQLSVKNKLSTLLRWLLSIEKVTGFSIPYTYTVNDLSIIFTYHEYIIAGIKTKLVKMHSCVPYINRNSFITILTGSLLKSSEKVIVYRCETSEFLEPTITNCEKYLITIENSIKNGIYIPNNQIVNCMSCIHNSKCRWNTANE